MKETHTNSREIEFESPIFLTPIGLFQVKLNQMMQQMKQQQQQQEQEMVQV